MPAPSKTGLACEIFEQFLHDPMHMLLASRRVLVDGSTLVLITPNVASYTAEARVLEMSGNPQLYSTYQESPRRICRLRSRPHARVHARRVRQFLERNHATPILCGKQMFLLARKKNGMPISRYPKFFYEGV